MITHQLDLFLLSLSLYLKEILKNIMFSLSCRYAGFLLGITNTFATIPGVVAPIATGYFTEDVSLYKGMIGSVTVITTVCGKTFGVDRLHVLSV